MRPLLLLAALPALLFPVSAQAEPKVRCAVGDICELTFPLFACKTGDPLKRWVELYVDESRDVAEAYLDTEEKTGQCVRFAKGDKLRIVRYIGMSRLEVARPDETQRWLMLLK
ncbi:hypothetical protein M2323_001368 [Rhodoblastus acidophilus]|uniref:hypothetical protein n=1 Tax=Rhodoblastus acidophilus TaxID=1074 RepID=UPI0022256AA8|nr:hypothetical protein [Rhodoblastus acidophilus]MCW2283596.1 hypothetical protein [Rhodoblastus acidophilus]MCW2332456.1 hypothetical protein [Rhodoblastus acidophilus]